MVQIFWPLMAQLSPSGTADVDRPARSEPEPGSLNNWHQVCSPVKSGASRRSRKSSLPCASMVGPASQVQRAVAAALRHDNASADVAAATRIWQRRCEVVLEQLSGYPCIRPNGGWSLLVDMESMGIAADAASRRLFSQSRVATTPMNGWGPSGSRYLRLVFANEPVERLGDLRDRFDAAFG
jgi:aspartate/methionine/tyrosine aminotransferase